MNYGKRISIALILIHLSNIIFAQNSDDLLVIFLPWFGRVRLPNKEYKITYPNSIIPPFHEYFTGNRSYNKKNHFLEIWGNEYSYDYFSKKMETQELINLRDSLLPKLISGELEINEINN